MMLHTNAQSFGPKPFRFENMWVTHPSFKELIHKWWNECEIGGSGGFRFMKKLGFIKGKIREWNRSSFGNLGANKDRLLSELQLVDSLMERDDNRPKDLNCQRKTVMAELERVLNAEECFWCQKSKCKWLKEGYENSKILPQIG